MSEIWRNDSFLKILEMSDKYCQKHHLEAPVYAVRERLP